MSGYAPKKKSLKLIVNDYDKVFDVAPRSRLLDVLRVDLGLTGTKEGL